MPFVFSNVDFWILFSLFLLVFSVTYKRVSTRNWVLLIFSLYFYYRSSGTALLLLLVVISQDFFIGKRIQLTQHLKQRKWLLTWSVISNLTILAYFKYAHFLTSVFNDLFGWEIEKKNWLALLVPQNDWLSFDHGQILLPIGISFFIFQSLSYTIDCYRQQVQTLVRWQDYALFVSFFPQLVAGPIVRAKDFVGQMFFPFQLDKTRFGKAVFLILGGLVKKIIISDILSTQLVDKVFDLPSLASSPEVWLAFYGYGMQIFCDFSGYTDIAIGLALLLGFELNPNFDQPYQSRSITEFWRRWHISLSVWLKDYLYIPLGGNRKGTFHTYLNLLITMLLGGLWHGANLKFLVWGGLHGLALAIHKFWISIGEKTRIPWPVSWFLTLHFVLLCWIPFRAKDFADSLTLVTRLFKPFSFSLLEKVIHQYHLPAILLCLGYGIHLFPWAIKNKVSLSFSKMPIGIQVLICVGVVVILNQFKSADSQPFIYFQF